jgi:hypothetical protein
MNQVLQPTNMESTEDQLLQAPPYGLDTSAKARFLCEQLGALTVHHATACVEYRNVVSRVFGGISTNGYMGLETVPFLPVSMFKTHQLKSIPDAAIAKVLTSSGTTGQAVSRIYLDNETAALQARVLIKLTQHFLGKQRMPMLILDHASVIKDRASFSARGAGILGMSQFGRNPLYALRDDMSLNVDAVVDYVNAASGPVFLFGFTFMVWQHFVQALRASGVTLRLPPGSTLIHSGGWKKLRDQAVTNDVFKRELNAVTGVDRCINFYGMVEQVGSVFFENELGYLQTPAFADVIIRDPATLKPVPDGQAGLVQVLSALPKSYPGHSILTEDLGVIRGSDVGGMRGRYFEILGRVAKAELRGCSDTFENNPKRAPMSGAAI